MVDLGALGGPSSDAFGINDDGFNVGEAWYSEFDSTAALFVDGQVIRLEEVSDMPAGWSLSQAVDSNNAGQTCG